MVIGILKFSAKLSASKIQTHLLEARSVKSLGEYLEKVKEILQSIDECAKEELCGWIIEQNLFQLTIEAERQRQLCEGIKRSVRPSTRPFVLRWVRWAIYFLT
jgi:hypothetical protein